MYVGGYDSADDCQRPTKHCQKLAILENKQHFDFHWSEHRNDITLLKLDGTLQSENYIKEIDIVPREKNIKGILISVKMISISSIISKNKQMLLLCDFRYVEIFSWGTFTFYWLW